MAYEWVAPTATAVTGTAGVLFAWLTSRSNGQTQRSLLQAGQRHESAAARRLEKRDAFVRLLAALDEFDRESQRIGGGVREIRVEALTLLPDGVERVGTFLKDLATDTQRQQMSACHQQLLDQVAVFDGKVHEVLLAGSEEVRDALLEARSDMIGLCREVANFEDWRFIAGPKRHALIDAMRADLGYTNSE